MNIPRVATILTLTSGALIAGSSHWREIDARNAQWEQVEGEERAKYDQRCVVQEGPSTLNLNGACDQLQVEIARHINTSLSETKRSGHLSAMEDLRPCSQFHWTDEPNRSAKEMLAAPGFHSHFTYKEKDCVSSFDVFMTDTQGQVCRLSTFCASGNDREQMDVYRKEDCSKENFDTKRALAPLTSFLE